MMKLYGARLLVENFDTSFHFYSQILGWKVTWGEPGGVYASFETRAGCGLSIFSSDLMAKEIGTMECKHIRGSRDNSMLIIQVESVDKVYEALLEKGINFINKPTDMAGWGIRTAHLRDPEGNLLELFSELDKSKWDSDLLNDLEKYSK